MKLSATNLTRPFKFLPALLCFTMLLFFAGCKKEDHHHHDPVFSLSTVASGLEAPMGIEVDKKGNIWVALAGNLKSGAKVVVIKPGGSKAYDAVINLAAITNAHSGQFQGAGHLMLDGDRLYVLSGDFLYNMSIANFNPGDKPINAVNKPHEDVGAFVHAYPWVNTTTHDSHPYNLTKAPDGHIYISDAGANAIIRRQSAGNYSAVAEIPGFANPTPVGPPFVEAVPTSIMFDGHDFLVTTLTGFPFISGKAIIYRVSLAGDVSVYEDGFTTLMDIAGGTSSTKAVLEHGSFGPNGFVPNSGSLTLINGNSKNTLTSTLNLPVAIKQVDNSTWYITSLGDGSVLKATYK